MPTGKRLPEPPAVSGGIGSKLAVGESVILNHEIPVPKTMGDLFTDSGSSLPVQRRGRHGVGRLNIDACLDLYGITNPNELWNHDYTPTSAGYRIRAALGGIGYGPKNKPLLPPPATPDNPMARVLRTALPKLPGSKREDLEAGLAMFGLTREDPSSLWDYRYLPGTAGYRLKEMLRCRGYKPPSKEAPAAPTVTNPVQLTDEQLADVENLPADILPRFANGKLDVDGGIKLLQITDPAELWGRKMKFGSAFHLLKQAIGTNAGRMAAVKLKLETTKETPHE